MAVSSRPGPESASPGFTVNEENYEVFKQAFEDEVSRTIDKNLLTPEVKVDFKIDLTQVDDRLMRILNQFAPFGPGNMTPIFMTENLKDTGYGKCVGEYDAHLRITVTQSGKEKIVCIGFGLGDKLKLIKNKKPFKAVYSVDENHWQGRTSLQLKLRDIK